MRWPGCSARVSGALRPRSVCQTLLAQLAAHNAKEEPVVYPKPGHLLSVEDIDKLEEWIRPFAGPGAAPRRAAADGPPLKT
jgi:hypothetical protein